MSSSMRGTVAAVVLAAMSMLLLAACGSSQRQPEPPSPAQAAQQREPTPAKPEERARAHTELGTGYYSIGQYGVAIEELNEALKADPNYVPALNSLGLVYMALKEDRKARANFERGVRLAPNDSDVNNNYGLFLCDRKQEKESLKYFVAALKNPLYRNPGETYVNAGICARRAGDVAMAEEFIMKAIALRPDDPRALFALADIQFNRGDFLTAKFNLTRYMQQVPNADSRALWLGARIEQRLGNRAEVMSYGSQLRTRFPGAPETQAYNSGQFE